MGKTVVLSRPTNQSNVSSVCAVRRTHSPSSHLCCGREKLGPDVPKQKRVGSGFLQKSSTRNHGTCRGARSGGLVMTRKKIYLGYNTQF